MLPIPLASPGHFERHTTYLGLTPEQWTSSKQLRKWCELNKDRHYIPEWLLDHWELKVDPKVS